MLAPADIGRCSRFLRAARHHVVRFDVRGQIRAVILEDLRDILRGLAVCAAREHEMPRVSGSVAVVGFIIMPVGMDAQHALRDADDRLLTAIAD